MQSDSGGEGLPSEPMIIKFIKEDPFLLFIYAAPEQIIKSNGYEVVYKM